MTAAPLDFAERPATGEPDRLLVLHHGRGSDEHDLLGLADALDPQRRLHVVTPAGPLRIPGFPGKHWYAVPRVGYPDPATFEAAFDALAAFHDALWERTGVAPERTVLGGFSMGAVMSFSLGLGALAGRAARPAPAGILAMSGFVPVAEGWSSVLDARAATRVLSAHGTQDPIIGHEFADRARALVGDAGLDLTVLDGPFAHHVEPRHVPTMASWLGETLPPRG